MREAVVRHIVVALFVGCVVAVSRTKRGEGFVSGAEIDQTAAEELRTVRKVLVGDVGGRVLEDEESEWDDFSQLVLRPTEFSLPNVSITTDTTFLGAPLQLDLVNGDCTYLTVDHIGTHRLSDPSKFLARAVGDGLTVDCAMYFSYRWRFARGDGPVEVTLRDSEIWADVQFLRDDQMKTVLCNSTGLIVDTVLFPNGGVTGGLNRLFQETVRSTVELQVEDTLCVEIETYIEEDFSDAVSDLSQLLANYTAQGDNSTWEQAESTFLQTTDSAQRLISFLDGAAGDGRTWLSDVIPWLLEILEESFTPANISDFLRTDILTLDDADNTQNTNWILPIAMTDVVLYSLENFLQSDMSLRFASLQLEGLDSITASIFNVTSDYTISAQVSFSKITVAADLAIDILQLGTNVTFLENLAVTVQLENVTTAAAFLIALNEDNLNDLVLASLWDSASLLTCLAAPPDLTIVEAAEVSRFALGDGLVVSREPVPIHVEEGSNLDSSDELGIVDLLHNASNVAFDWYEQELMRAAPSLVSGPMRKRANLAIGEHLHNSPDTCGPRGGAASGKNAIVNYWDFLLPPEDAASLGGTGSVPYGDVPSVLYGWFQDELSSLTTDIDEATCSADKGNLNTEYVDPISEALSGAEGTIVVGTLYEDWKPWDTTIKDVCNPPPSVPWWVKALQLDTLSISIRDLQFTNVNTISSASILHLRTLPSPYELYNHIAWGCSTAEQPLGVDVTVSMNIGGGADAVAASPLAMTNTLNFNLKFAGLEATVGVLAKMEEAALLDFRIGQLPFVECWLATLTELGLTNVTNVRRINDDDFTSWNAICDNCTTSGLYKLPRVLRSWSDANLVSLLIDGLLQVATDVMTSKWFQQNVMEKEVRQPAARQCARRQDRRNLAKSGTATGDKDKNDCETPPPFQPSVTPPPPPPKTEKERLVLTTESAETIMLGGVAFFQALWVVVSESVLNSTDTTAPETSDPLFNNGLNDTTTLVDFVNGSVLEPFRSSIEAFLIANDTQTNSSRTDIGANTLLTSSVLDDQEAFSWSNMSIDIPYTEFSISALRVFGLNTIQRVPELQLFRPTGPQSLRALVKFDELRVEADALVLENDETATKSTRREAPITVSMGVRNVTVTLDLFLALNKTMLGDLPLNVLMRSEQSFPCLASTLVAAEVTQLVVSVEEVMIPTAVGFSSPERERVVARAVEDVMAEFGEDLLTPAFPFLFSGRGLSVINDLLQHYVNVELPAQCNDTFVSGEWEGDVDFRDLFLLPDEAKSLGGTGQSPYGDLIPVAKSEFSKELAILTPQSKERLDALLSGMTKGQSGEEGTLRFFAGDDAITQSSEIELSGSDVVSFTVRASNVRVENLGIETIRPPIKILDPMFQKVSALNSSLTVGLDSSESLRFAGTFLVELKSADGLILRDEVDMGLIVEDAEVAIEILAIVSERLLLGFPFRDVFNIHCWIATIPAPPLTPSGTRQSGVDRTAGIIRLMSQIHNASFFVNCISCTSTKVEEFVELLADPANAADINRATTSIISQLLDVSTGELLQVQVDRILSEAPYQCPHRDVYEEAFTGSTYEAFSVPRGSETADTATNVLVGVVAALAIVLVLVTVLSLLEYWVARRLHKAWLLSLPDEDLLAIGTRHSQQEARDKMADKHTSSMAKSKDVPAFVRFGMPIVFMANSLLFASGHLIDGFSLKISVDFGGKKVIDYSFLRYSLLGGTVELFKQGGRSLALVVFVASILWPYVKLLIMMVLWFASPSTVSVRRRELTIRWVDFLGKWSMIDIIVVWIVFATFRVELRSDNDISFLPNDLYNIKALVVPLWGLVSHLLAQIVSQISSQVFSYYHDRVVEEARRTQEVAEEQFEEVNVAADKRPSAGGDEQRKHSSDRTALASHVFLSNGRIFVLRNYVTPLLGTLALVTVAVVVAGCVVPLFQVELLGVLSYLARMGPDWSQEDSLVDFTVMSMAEAMSGWGYSDVLNRRELVASGVFAAVLVASILIFPLLEAFTLLFLWFVPLSHDERKRTIGAVYIFDDWQYLEVFLVAVVLTVWQLGSISGVADEYCADLEPLFSSLVQYGIMDSEDAQCFQLVGRVRVGAFCLVAALGVLAILRHFVLQAAEQVVEEEDTARSNGWSGKDRSTASVENPDPIVTRQPSLLMEDRDRAIRDIPFSFSAMQFTDAFRFALMRSS